MEFLPRRDRDANTAFQSFRAEIRLPGPRKKSGLKGTIPRMYTETRASQETNGTNVAIREAVSPDDFADCLSKLLPRIRDLQLVHGRGGIKTIEMVPKPKQSRTLSRLIAADAFEHSASVVQRM